MSQLGRIELTRGGSKYQRFIHYDPFIRIRFPAQKEKLTEGFLRVKFDNSLEKVVIYLLTELKGKITKLPREVIRAGNMSVTVPDGM